MRLGVFTAFVCFLAVCAIPVSFAYAPYAYGTPCSFQTESYGTTQPFACLDGGIFDSVMVLLVRNTGDESVQINSIAEPPRNVGSYYNNQQVEVMPCSYGLDLNKDGESEPINGQVIPPGTEFIIRGYNCKFNAALYGQETHQPSIYYSSASHRASVANSAIFMQALHSRPAVSFSALYYIPLIALLVLAFSLIAAAKRAKQEKIMLGGKS